MPWSVRPLASADAADVAAVFAASRRAAMPWLPVLHTPAEDVAFFAAEVESSSGWAAVDEGRLVGFGLLRDGWLNHLYVDPEWRGRGVGSALLSRALAEAGSTVDLWAFERNEPALVFYARHGFRVVERTDGSSNDEKEPDVRMRHTPGVLVRRAGPLDADGVARVHVRGWQAAYAGLIDDDYLRRLDVADRRHAWHDRLAGGDPGVDTYVATAGADVVGFASVGPPRDEDLARQQERWAEVYAVYVEPARWRTGVGTALWDAVADGQGDGTAAVALWVLLDNLRAREFYTARGLAPDGAQRPILIGKRELTEVRMVIWR